MRIHFAVTLTAATVLAFAANATPTIKSTLPCTFGQSMDVDHMLDIQNTTKAPLKTEAIVNLDIKTDTNGEQFDCFALTAPLAAGAHISHMEKITVTGKPNVCKAYISAKYPAIQHGSDGSSSTQCDY
jgi:hypothetical protein